MTTVRNKVIVTRQRDRDDNKLKQHGVTLVPDVWRIIMRLLNAKEIQTAARVCRLWRAIADEEKKRRDRSPILSFFGEYENLWTDLIPRKPFIDNLRVPPMLALNFSNPFSRSCMEEVVKDCPCRGLPPSCPNIVVQTDGIIKDQTECEMDVNISNYILLPDSDDVHIETLYQAHYGTTTLNRINKNRKAQQDITPENMFARLTNSDKRVKCCILLAIEYLPPPNDIVGRISRNYRGSLWGGIVKNLSLCKRDSKGDMCNEPMLWVSVLISGPSVRSWSTILEKECKSKSAITNKLLELKKLVKLRKKSMGFMFACTERGEYLHSEPDVEPTIFKNIFPTVPLIGCFGDGEYGNITDECRFKTIDSIIRFHQYSTIFMILTYGPEL